jgi:hypothetical protein
MTLNARWHRAHPLGESASRSERIAWHVEHAAQCGCRPVPDSLSAEVTRRRRSVGAVRVSKNP